MSTLATSSDLGAIQQLEALFHSADPTRTGLLSYSEFAYLILKSGGSPEQVDALIDQFSIASRAQRMVCYAALLQHLSDSVKGGPSHSQDTQPTHAAGVTEHSPLPVPPPQASLHTYVNVSTSALPAVAAAGERRSASSAYPSNRTSAPTQRMATSSSPLLRSVTHAGSRGGSAASRESSIASSGPFERRQQSFSDGQQRRSSSTSGSPWTPLQPSSRFVASVVRTAQLQGTPGGRRGRSDEGVGAAAPVSRSRSSTPLPGRSPQEWSGINVAGHHEKRQAFVPARLDQEFNEHTGAQPRVSPARSSPSRSRSREDSVVRMTRAAKDAQARKGNHVNAPALPKNSQLWKTPSGGVPLRDSSNALTAPQPTADSLLLSSSRNAHIVEGNARQHDSVLPSASVTANAALLSLRDVFHRNVLPAAAAKDGTVLLSELEGVFAAHGVEVHPLELEAVVDSLELLPDNTPTSARSSNVDGGTHTQSGVHHTSSSFSSFATTAGNNTTVTGGADCALGLVDFCVLVSRLRPGLIQRIRRPATWNAPPRNVEMGVVHNGGSLGTAAAVDVARQRVQETTTALPRRSVGHTVLDGDAVEEGSGGESEEASIADVTVSPMTPTTAGTTPQSHRGSSLQRRPQLDAPSRPSSAVVDSRGPLSLRRQPLYDTPNGSSRSYRTVFQDAAPTPPTARQLSSDRQFSVLDEPHATSARSSPRNGEAQRAGYALSTASSERHRRSRVRTSPSPSATTHGEAAGLQRRRKEPVWHTEPNTVSRQGATRATCTNHAAPRRVSVSISSSPTPRRREMEHRRTLSPLSSSSPSPSSSSPGYPQEREMGVHAGGWKAPTLSPDLLDTVQSAASTMLRRCTQLDTRHTGYVPAHAWVHVLRSSCPSLTGGELRKVEEWVARIRQRHACTRGDAYAAVVEEILTQGSNAAAAAGGTPSPSPSHVVPSSASATPAPTASAGGSLQRLSPRAAPHVRGDDSAGAHRRLRDELMAACGGDTEALQAYLDAFDAAHQGYLHEHVWRASLEELFRRTTSRTAPRWVLEESYRLSRLPFDRVAAQEQGGVAVRPQSAAERAACARVRRIPTEMRDAFCDYRYVLQELHLDASL
ncbi:hypothetical protein ABB37_05356 [Leptomonas pyrrhocoris]|uniref:EF-hand domain-containing protein n=1 Tax=Leptomonas pyrrhocoris TaxID=157538 RepID=A0A0N0DUW3_LEPPY|nr:hypothetical protein ABB37_05356 [Leptomonas pyrrhocoris]KPA79538.1 hypothetical protein ABB37_05356 [Leptomonas pyrrhocoris]|eukprot:XP_015657977.1 hypothetical protein ABB37_05356 [Leptomonas pyrrhocoris]